MQPFKPQQLPIVNLDWRKLLPLVGKANAALSQYNGLLEGMINPHILLSPLTIQEATLSSKIEGTQATLSEVLEGNAGKTYNQKKDQDIKEIINYRNAMLEAEVLLKERPFIHLNMLRKLHKILLDGVRGKEKGPGEFRRDQNWIGTFGCSLSEAKYVPPSPLDMQIALDNWEKYVNNDEEELLIQLSIMHAQFEIIHPFKDGNGRIGRILIPLFLFTKKYLKLPVFYLSEFLENNRDYYYSALNGITNSGQWQTWTEFFLKAITHQANSNIVKAKQILNLYNEMKETIQKTTHSEYSLQILDTLFSTPIFNTRDFMKISKIKTKGTTSKLINKLILTGTIQLIEQGKGRTNSRYLFKKLLDIIEQ